MLGNKTGNRFLIYTAGIIALRTAFLFAFTDPATGFFRRTLPEILMVSVFYAAAATGYPLVRRLTAGINSDICPNAGKKSIRLGLACFLLAFAAEFYSYIGVADVFYRNGPTAVRPLVAALEITGGILSGIIFSAHGLFYFTGKERPKLLARLLAIPTFWMCEVIFARFVSFVSVAHIVSEQLLVIFFLAGAVFLLEHAKFSAGIPGSCAVRTARFGCAGGVLGAVFFVSEFLFMLSGAPAAAAPIDLLLVFTLGFYELSTVESFLSEKTPAERL